MRAVISLLPDTGEPMVAEVPKGSIERIVLGDVYDSNRGKEEFSYGAFSGKQLKTLEDMRASFEDPTLFFFLGQQK